jgi:hypothetical protein
MRIRNPGAQHEPVDREADNHEVIPGAWRADAVLEDVNAVRGPTRAAKEAKQQRVYLMHYLNTVGAVPWQRHMI